MHAWFHLECILFYLADRNRSRSCFGSEESPCNECLAKPVNCEVYRHIDKCQPVADYYNALISSNNLKELSTVFEIDTIDANELVGFAMKIGPETPNDVLLEYNQYLKSVDSSLTDDITYDTYAKNRDFLSGSIFSISAWSLLFAWSGVNNRLRTLVSFSSP